MAWHAVIVSLLCSLQSGHALYESGKGLDRHSDMLLSLQQVKSGCSGLRSVADWSALGPPDSKGVSGLESACYWVEQLQIPELLVQDDARYLKEEIDLPWWGDSNEAHYPLVPMAILSTVCFLVIILLEQWWLKSTIFRIHLHFPEMPLPEIKWSMLMLPLGEKATEKKKDNTKRVSEKGQAEIMGIVDKMCRAIKPLQPAPPQKAALRFRNRVFFANVHDKQASIEVDRVGPCDSEVKVKVRTVKDGQSLAAEAGKSYKQTEVELVFRPGEKKGVVQVPLLDNFCWTATKWFCVELGPITSGDAQLYPERHIRTFVVDDDLYPGSIPASELDKDFFGTRRWALAYYFMKECAAFRKEKFWKTFVAMLYPPIHDVVIQTLVQKFIITYVAKCKFTTENYHGAMYEIIFLSCIHFLSVCLYRWADVVQTKNRGRTGGIRQTHRLHLLDKMLMIGHNQHMQYKGSTWLYAAIHDVDSLTMDVYWQFFIGLQALESMLLSFLVIVLWDVVKVSSDNENYSISKLTPTISFVVIMPIISAWIWKRRKEVGAHVQARKDREADWLNVFSWMAEVGHYMYGFGFGELGAIEAEFKRENKAFVKDHQITRDTMNDSVAIAVWLSTLAYMVILIWGGLALLANEDGTTNQTTVIDAGHYALLLSLFSQFGKYITKLHDCIVKLQRGTVSLERIQMLLNMPDEPHTATKRLSLAGGVSEPEECILLESVCLKIENKRFGIGPFGEFFTKKGSKIRIPLGRMVCVTSKDEGRMLGLLGLAAGVIPPTSGEVYCPEHVWRAMASTSPVHFIGDLCCGDELVTTGITREQAVCLLTSLGIDPAQGSRHLPPGELQLIMLLRALLRDPEVLVLAEPLAYVNKHRAQDAIKLIRVWQAYGGAPGLLQLCDSGVELKQESNFGTERTVIISLIDVSQQVDTDYIIDLDEFWDDGTDDPVAESGDVPSDPEEACTSL